MRVPQAGFLRGLRALADRHRLLLIVDEVQTGVGRCGTPFAFQPHGIEPDLMTLAKGLGGGVPLAALLCRDRFDCFRPGDQGGTFSGNPLMAAVGCAVLDTVLAEGFLAQVRERANQLAQGLARLAQRHGSSASAASGCCVRWSCRTMALRRSSTPRASCSRMDCC